MNWFASGFVTAVVCAGAALRRHGDLGDTVPGWAFWSLLLLAAVLLLSVAPRDTGPTPPTPSRGLLYGPAACALVWLLAVPTETAVVVSVVAGCWVLAGVTSTAGTRWRAATALEFVLFVLLALVATTWLVDQISLLRIASTSGAQLIAGALQALGIEAASSGAQVLQAGPRQQQAFLVTGNNLGLATHLAVFVVVVGARLLGRPVLSRRDWLLALGYLPTALLLRFVSTMGVGIALDHTTPYDDPDFNLAALLDWRVGLAIDLVAGLAAAQLWLRRPRDADMAAATTMRRPRHGLLLATAVVTGILWSSDGILDACGQRAPEAKVRVAVDELHSRWESSDIRLTRDHYGQESGYNFRGLCSWLEGRHGPIRRLYEPASDATLTDVDVLVVKTPTQAFSGEELAAIDRFVANGGGLVLIGDHTNVYGTSEILNSIASPLGFRFAYDCCFDHRQRFEFRYQKEPHVARHPVLAGMQDILFEVGCTIDIDSPRVRPILVGRSLKSQPIDYGIENYYGKPRDRSEQECGQFPILVAANRGKGRVVAIADSTLFSTFSVFMPGRCEIVDGMIAYVSGRDVGESGRDLAWRLAVGMTLLLFLVLLPGTGIGSLVTCCLLAWGASNLSTALAWRCIYPGHPDMAAANAPSVVDFVWETTNVEWPTHGFVAEPDRCFSLFYQFVTRVGAFPRLVRDPQEALAGPGPVVWIDAAPEDANAAAAAVVARARAGGTVILMEREPRALVTAVARHIGLRLTGVPTEPDGACVVSCDGRASAGGLPSSRGIDGGSPMLRVDGSGRVVAAAQDVGDGRIVIVTCGGLFADARYGFRYGSVPDARLRRLYELQYSMLQSAFR